MITTRMRDLRRLFLSPPLRRDPLEPSTAGLFPFVGAMSYPKGIAYQLGGQMASIADLLGVQWEGGQSEDGYRLNTHAAKQATMKGFDHSAVLAAANDPHHTYPNGRYPGQMRHVRSGIVAVVDPSRREVVTVYEDQRRTAPRSDQTDRDARRYARTWNRSVGGSR